MGLKRSSCAALFAKGASCSDLSLAGIASAMASCSCEGGGSVCVAAPGSRRGMWSRYVVAVCGHGRDVGGSSHPCSRSPRTRAMGSCFVQPQDRRLEDKLHLTRRNVTTATPALAADSLSPPPTHNRPLTQPWSAFRPTSPPRPPWPSMPMPRPCTARSRASSTLQAPTTTGSLPSQTTLRCVPQHSSAQSMT